MLVIYQPNYSGLKFFGFGFHKKQSLLIPQKKHLRDAQNNQKQHFVSPTHVFGSTEEFHWSQVMGCKTWPEQHKINIHTFLLHVHFYCGYPVIFLNWSGQNFFCLHARTRLPCVFASKVVGAAELGLSFQTFRYNSTGCWQHHPFIAICLVH